MLFTSLGLLFCVFLPIVFCLIWLLIQIVYFSRPFSIRTIIPLAIVLLTELIIGLFFLTKVYVIEPDTHSQKLFVLGNYKLKIPDGQNVDVKYSDPKRVVIINSTVFDINYYGVRFGEADSTKLRIPAKIIAHTSFKTDVNPDILPDEKIPQFIDVNKNEYIRGKILNVLQFEENNILPY